MISFSGLSSGLDTAAIVNALVSSERRSATVLQGRKSDADARLSVVGNLVSRLRSLQTQAQSLDSQNKVSAYTATSSNESRIKVTATGAATAGNYAITVNSLASAQTNRSTGFSVNIPGIAGDGNFDVMVGGGAPVNISYTNDDALADIAARINENVSGANAFVMFDGTAYRLVVSSKEPGLDNAISFGENDLGIEEIEAASDASVTINGITVTRSSNLLTDVVDGLSFSLLSKTPDGEAATNVAVTENVSGQRDNLQKLVNAFNDVARLVGSQMTYNGVPMGRDTLFGDPSLQGLQRRMGGLIATGYAYNDTTVSLAQFGIKLAGDGTLTLDAGKFDSEIAKNPTALESLLTGPGGLVNAINQMVDQYTKAGDGVLTTKQKSIRDMMADFDRQIGRIEKNADSLAQRLQRQFNALEVAMTKLQSQSNYLMSLFSGGLR